MPQVAVVTGGSSGIGAAVARALRGRGWHCGIAPLAQALLPGLVSRLGARGIRPAGD